MSARSASKPSRNFLVRLALSIGAWLAYCIAFPFAFASVDVAAATLVTLPVMATGGLLGLRAGIIAALANIPLNAILFNLVGLAGWDIMFQRFPGIFAALLVGAGAGWLSDLVRFVQKQSRELREQIAKRQATEIELRQSRDELEHKVAERTTALAERVRLATFDAAIGVALSRADSLAIGLRHCTEAMVAHLDAAFARIWLYDPALNTLVLHASAGMYTRLDGTFSRHPLDGDTRIAIIARARKPYLTNAAVDDPGIKNKEWARREGMIAFAGYPLLIGDRLIGVMAMFARQPLGEPTLAALDSVANTLALGVERIRAEESLRREQKLFSQGPAIVFHWRAAEQWPVEYVSANVFDQWGYASSDLTSGKILYATLVHPADLERVAHEVQTHSASGVSSFKQVYRIIRADGQARWIDDYTVVHRDEHGAITHYAGYVLDITERKRAEDELRARERFLLTLKDITRAALGTDDFQTMLQLIADRLSELINADGCYITLWDEAHQRTIPAAAYGPLREIYPQPFSAPGEITMTASVMRAGKALVAEDVFNSPYLSPRIAAKYPARSLLGLPLIAGDQKLGAALIAFNQPHHFIAEEIERGEQAARHIALAIAKVKSFDQAQVSLMRLSALYEIAHAMIGSTDIAPALELVCRRAAELVSAPKSVLCAWNAENEHALVAHYGLRDPEHAIEEYTNQARTGMFDQAELNQRGAFGMSEMPAQIDEMPEFVQRENVQSVAHAPLRVAQNQIGVLLDFDTQPRLWTDDELQVLDLLAHQAAIGLDKARLFAETQTALNLMTRLYDLSGQMLSVTTLEETARVVTETLRDSFAAHVFSLDLLDAAGNLEFQYGVGRADTAYQNVPPRPDGLTMRVWKSGERFIANDPAELHPQARADGFQSAIVLPLRGKTRTLGVLYLQYREPHTFNEREIQRLTLFANQTATTIENVRLVQETRHRLAELEAVNRISTALRSARALDEMLPLLLDETRVILNAPAGAIYLFDPVKNELSITVARGWYTQLPRVPIQQNEGVVGHVCATGQAYISREFARDPLIRARARSQIPFGFGGIVAPIRSAHAIVGALAISVPLPREITSEQTHLLSTLAEIAGNAIQRMRLHEQTERDAVELARAYDATLAGWSRALELRDEETEGHSARVTRLTLQLARAMGLSEEDLVHIRRGVLVHDIGKMGIPDSILLKPGALDAAEWEVMRWHPVYAHEMLAPISFLRHALAIPFCHHEKWDGTGYPRGLKGEDIPLAARIFAVVDVWDALTSNRPYRSAWTRDQVREYIRAHTGTHFDPQVVEKFLQIVNAE